MYAYNSNTCVYPKNPNFISHKPTSVIKSKSLNAQPSCNDQVNKIKLINL